MLDGGNSVAQRGWVGDMVKGRVVAIAALSLALAIFTGPLGTTEARAQQQTFTIPAQSVESALKEFARQADIEVLFTAGDVAELTSPGVSGAATRGEALAGILDGTRLVYSFEEEDLLVVRVPADGSGRINSITPSDNSSRLAQASGTQAAAEDDFDDGEESIEEVIVTGSHIRGARSASPVQIYTRNDIDLTGVSTLAQFVQTLPQNFGGGSSESTLGITSENDASLNIAGGSGINLRGLGNDSTLVLLNGRRLAPAGFGNFVDISMIPLSAIEQVEVLTDGASAIYGSDAIGGVVNFKLRHDFDGAETRLRYGSATSGDLDEIQVGQTFGTTWSDGHALISYEYQKRDELDASDRSFSADALPLHQLLPNRRRHSVFFSGGMQLAENTEVFGDAVYSKRNNDHIFSSNVTAPRLEVSESEQFGGSVGTSMDLPNDWRAEIVSSYNQNRTARKSLLLDQEDFSPTASRISRNWSIDGKVDGSLFRLSGGEIKLAVGGQFRRDTFKNPSLDTLAARNVFAFFGEMLVPLVGEANRTAGIERLELTVAGRYEHYSDFGSSTNPKLGLLWSPAKGLALRGTFGTSFRAPLFTELDESSVQGFLFNGIPNPASPTGTSLVAFVLGGNANLQPETATSWTVGFDLNPSSIPGFSLEATYFDISYKNRISNVLAVFDVITNPRFSSVLDFSPDPSFLEQIGSLPTSFNFAPGFLFTDADVLADERERNQAQTQVNGLDFIASYTFENASGNWGVTLGGTYLFKSLEQILESEDIVDVLDTVGRPVDIKIRGGVSWAYKGFSTNMVVNYVDGYRNAQVEPEAGVNSWTTMDLILSYNTGDQLEGTWLDNTVFSLSAINLFDRDPPFVVGNFNLNINYDPNNASPVGRTIAFQITKRW